MNTSSYIAGAAAFVMAAIASVFGKELIDGMEMVTFLIMSGLLIFSSIIHLIVLKDILGTGQFIVNTILAGATTAFIESIPRYSVLTISVVHTFWGVGILILLLTVLSIAIFLLRKGN